LPRTWPASTRTGGNGLTVAVAEALETNRPVEPLALLVLLARR